MVTSKTAPSAGTLCQRGQFNSQSPAQNICPNPLQQQENCSIEKKDKPVDSLKKKKKCGRGKHGHFLLRQAGRKNSAHGGIEFSSAFFGTKNNLCVHPAEQSGAARVCVMDLTKPKSNNYITTFNFCVSVITNQIFVYTKHRNDFHRSVQIHPPDLIWIKFRLILRSVALALLLLRPALTKLRATARVRTDIPDVLAQSFHPKPDLQRSKSGFCSHPAASQSCPDTWRQIVVSSKNLDNKFFWLI